MLLSKTPEKSRKEVMKRIVCLQRVEAVDVKREKKFFWIDSRRNLAIRKASYLIRLPFSCFHVHSIYVHPSLIDIKDKASILVTLSLRTCRALISIYSTTYQDRQTDRQALEKNQKTERERVSDKCLVRSLFLWLETRVQQCKKKPRYAMRAPCASAVMVAFVQWNILDPIR